MSACKWKQGKHTVELYFMMINRDHFMFQPGLITLIIGPNYRRFQKVRESWASKHPQMENILFICHSYWDELVQLKLLVKFISQHYRHIQTSTNFSNYTRQEVLRCNQLITNQMETLIFYQVYSLLSRTVYSHHKLRQPESHMKLLRLLVLTWKSTLNISKFKLFLSTTPVSDYLMKTKNILLTTPGLTKKTSHSKFNGQKRSKFPKGSK